MIEFTASDIVRFWRKVEINGAGDCWLWTGSKDTYGYGRVRIGGIVSGSHKISYILANGLDDIPFGKLICHHCDNPPCCNPRHLYLGDHSTNSLDMYSRGRGRRLYGENNNNYKLTAYQVLEIREKYQGGIKQKELASMYGVSLSAINQIIMRKTWKDVG